MCQRLAEVEAAWHSEQRAALLEMEQLGTEMKRHEHQIELQSQHLAKEAEWINSERQRLRMGRSDLDRLVARFQTEKIEYRAELARREIDLLRREDRLEKREKALDSLLHRWHDRRQAEVTRLRRHIDECIAARKAWIEARDEALRRSESLRVAQQSLAEQAIAIEEVRQSLLKDVGQAERAARQIEKHRRRWEQAGRQAGRTLEKYRQQLVEEDNELRQIFLELEQQRESLARDERDLNQRRSELERDRFQIERMQSDWNHDRQAWENERAILQSQIAQLQKTLSRLVAESNTAADEADPRIAA
jgi:chromosome segregation ATPase